MKQDRKNRTWSRKSQWWRKKYYRWTVMGFIPAAPRKGNCKMTREFLGIREWAREIA